MTSATIARERPRLFLWLTDRLWWWRPRRVRNREQIVRRDLAALPAHLRRDIGL